MPVILFLALALSVSHVNLANAAITRRTFIKSGTALAASPLVPCSSFLIPEASPMKLPRSAALESLFERMPYWAKFPNSMLTVKLNFFSTPEFLATPESERQDFVLRFLESHEQIFERSLLEIRRRLVAELAMPEDLVKENVDHLWRMGREFYFTPHVFARMDAMGEFPKIYEAAVAQVHPDLAMPISKLLENHKVAKGLVKNWERGGLLDQARMLVELERRKVPAQIRERILRLTQVRRAEATLKDPNARVDWRKALEVELDNVMKQGFDLTVRPQTIELKQDLLMPVHPSRGGGFLPVYEGDLSTSMGGFKIFAVIDHRAVLQPELLVPIGESLGYVMATQDEFSLESGRIESVAPEVSISIDFQTVQVVRLRGAAAKGYRVPVFEGFLKSSIGDLKVLAVGEEGSHALHVYLNVGAGNYR